MWQSQDLQVLVWILQIVFGQYNCLIFAMWGPFIAQQIVDKYFQNIHEKFMKPCFRKE
jgi:hypothetical protein